MIRFTEFVVIRACFFPNPSVLIMCKDCKAYWIVVYILEALGQKWVGILSLGNYNLGSVMAPPGRVGQLGSRS